MTDLEALAKLATEATPGPWEVDVFEDGTATVLQANAMTEALCVADLREGVTDRPEANAAFIAAASPDVVLALVRVALAAMSVTAYCGVEMFDEDGDGIGRYIDVTDFDDLRAALAGLSK